MAWHAVSVCTVPLWNNFSSGTAVNQNYCSWIKSYNFLTELEVFQGLLRTDSSWKKNCRREQNVYRAIVNNRLSIVRLPWDVASSHGGRAMAERLKTVSRSAFSPAEDKHLGSAHVRTGVCAVEHDVMTSGRVLKHSRLWSLWACNKSQETTTTGRNIYPPVFTAVCFQTG